MSYNAPIGYFMSREVTIVGWINVGKPADCGETMKNQLLIRKLEREGLTCNLVDFKNWRRHPLVFVKLLYCLFFKKNYPLILSTSTKNVYPMMKIMKILRWKQNTILWVIGGALGENTVNGVFEPSVIGYMNWILVESKIMVDQLNSVGISSVMHVPNFKPITYYPDIDARLNSLKNGRVLRFVFLSRIMPEKGCEYILESVKILNQLGYEQKFQVCFYGKIADSYEKDFFAGVKSLPNVSFDGFLNLRESEGLDKLSEFDVMLFPTYWKGEGFAGVFMDSFICGVPMIASDWAHNRQFITENENAMFVPVHDVSALTDKMRQCIDRSIDLVALSRNCQRSASQYDIENVVSIDLLTKIGLLEK